VAALPGIEGTAQVGTTPLTPGSAAVTARLADAEWFPLQFNAVSADYFSLTAIPIVRGRTFTDAELADSGAIIVTEATARRLWPDRDPLGQVVQQALSNPYSGEPVRTLDMRVVGVAKDAQLTGIGKDPSSYAYFPATGARQALQLLARSGLDFAATASAIRAAAAELDPELVVNVTPLEQNLDFYRSLAGLASTLATALGALALTLAAVGVYDVVAYAVGRRTREIGIRIALGANAQSVVALMLKRSMRPVAVGAVVGIAAAVGVSQVLSSVLFGVSPVDPLALFGAAAVVGGVALAAGTLPARRAARVDPSRTLHYD
jgi:ABC-type antimicrobial peptide transport system permease subunit